MKTLFPILVVLSSTVLSVQAQLEQSRADAAAALTPPAAMSRTTAFSPVNRGQDHITWERYRFETNRSGRTITHTNRYVELQTGKHYLQNGRWLESSEEIQIVANGAVATNGPHKVGFTANINSPVPVVVLTPDNKRLKIRPLGLAYYDFHTKEQVLIAELKDSEGLLVGTNQVLYPDAFTEFRADIRYTYKKSGLEQDVILRQRPPSPEEYGLNPATTWLWVLTEFIGFHYVAVDASGNAIDGDGDGVSDYWEDTNGDGVYGTGDLSDWGSYESQNGLGAGNGLQVFTPLQ